MYDYEFLNSLDIDSILNMALLFNEIGDMQDFDFLIDYLSKRGC